MAPRTISDKIRGAVKDAVAEMRSRNIELRAMFCSLVAVSRMQHNTGFHSLSNMGFRQNIFSLFLLPGSKAPQCFVDAHMVPGPQRKPQALMEASTGTCSVAVYHVQEVQADTGVGDQMRGGMMEANEQLVV